MSETLRSAQKKIDALEDPMVTALFEAMLTLEGDEATTAFEALTTEYANDHEQDLRLLARALVGQLLRCDDVDLDPVIRNTVSLPPARLTLDKYRAKIGTTGSQANTTTAGDQ